jgi:ABC-type Na+ transport system ATPase subunit NatA
MADSETRPAIAATGLRKTFRDHVVLDRWGTTLAREPDAVRAAIGVAGHFSAVDSLLTGEENLRLMADLHHLTRGEGGRRTTRMLDQST